MAILSTRRKGTTATLGRRRPYKQDIIHALIELDAQKGRRARTKRRVRGLVKKNAESIPIPLGPRHKMAFSKAFESLAECGLIEPLGKEDDLISWTAKGKEQLHAARNTLGLPPSFREELTQDQLIRITQLFDASTTTRSRETKTQPKSENQKLKAVIQQLRYELSQHEEELARARKQILQLKVENLESQLFGHSRPMSPFSVDGDDTLVHPGDDDDDENEIGYVGGPMFNIPELPATLPSVLPPPVIMAPHPVRPTITASGSWINPITKRPSPAPTQAPEDEDEDEDENDVTMVTIDEEEEEEEALRHQLRKRQLPTPDNTPARPVRSHSHSLILPMERETVLQQQLSDAKNELKRLQNQLEEKSTEVANCDEKVKKVTSERDGLQARFDAETINVEKMETRIRTLEENIATVIRIKAQNLDLQTQIEDNNLRLQTEYQKVEAENFLLQTDNRSLKRKLDDADRDIKDLEDEMERKEGILGRMGRMLEEVQQEPARKRRRSA